MQHTHMYRKNTWDFAFGDCDQGFLFHMFYLHEPSGGTARPIGADFEATPDALDCRPMKPDELADATGRCPHTARHYWGPRKPWQLESDNAGRVAHYLAHTDYSGKTGVCAERFASWAKRLPKVDLQFYPKRFNGKVQRIR